MVGILKHYKPVFRRRSVGIVAITSAWVPQVCSSLKTCTPKLICVPIAIKCMDGFTEICFVLLVFDHA